MVDKGSPAPMSEQLPAWVRWKPDVHRVPAPPPGIWRKTAAPPSETASYTPSGRSAAEEAAEGFLGRSTGLQSAGAWAARLEVANLLEARCNPDRLVKEIRKGVEGSHPMMADGSILDTIRADLSSESFTVASDSEVETFQGTLGEWKKKQVSQEAEVAKQKRILDSTMSEARPPLWLEDKGRIRPAGTPAWIEKSQSPGERFSKRAAPPTAQQRMEHSLFMGGPAKQEHSPPIEVEEAPRFAKRAVPPSPSVKVEEDDRFNPKIKTGSRVHPGTSQNMAEREEADLKRFLEMSSAIFEELVCKGVNLGLAEIVLDGSGGIDADRFRMHVEPNRASTGLRYARLVKAFLEWIKDQANPFQGKPACFEKLNGLAYIEHLMLSSVGANTPLSFLYALDFYSRSLGFELGGNHYARGKRLALRYAQHNKVDKKSAPMFPRQLLVTLERVVLDGSFPLTERVACGKLRVCIQSSMRHNDLLNTPLAAFEWVRHRGDLKIVGLRSKAVKGKTKARAWICSLLGADSANDKWLSVFVKILVQSHGASWKSHDFTGRLPSATTEGFLEAPSTIEQDVGQVKTCLLGLVAKGVPVGLDRAQVELLRWHSCKATLTSLMQHLGLRSKVVRFSGDWSSRDESMEDVYLREAQLLTLKGQERCLAFLRKGGDIGGLVGESIVVNPDGTHSDVSVEEFLATDTDVGKELGDYAMEPADAFEEMLDEKFSDGLPDMEGIESEPAVDLDKGILGKMLESDSDGEVVAPYREKEVAAVRSESEPAPLEESEVSKQFAKDDTEGMVCRFVVPTKATLGSGRKMHLPPSGDDPEAGPVVAKPRCGARGEYSFIDVEEACDSEPCLRCFGRNVSTCLHLCGKKVVLDTEPPILLVCARRCCDNSGADHEHCCSLHEVESLDL